MNLSYELAMAERGVYRGRTITEEQALRLVGFLNELRLVVSNQLRADTYRAGAGYPDSALVEVLFGRVERAGMSEFWSRTVSRAASGLS
ncbi:hypothetical protein [Kitasatospora viridis]|uniref:hypothetical protein n=1 Tax=Kitasatospora viridis TaxID=281105 RepID=UPI0011A6D79E|nr:hypothetical protein [Kitasatospora viridis]